MCGKMNHLFTQSEGIQKKKLVAGKIIIIELVNVCTCPNVEACHPYCIYTRACFTTRPNDHLLCGDDVPRAL